MATKQIENDCRIELLCHFVPLFHNRGVVLLNLHAPEDWISVLHDLNMTAIQVKDNYSESCARLCHFAHFLVIVSYS